MKYILVTGGVISGVGKGVIASSFGTILKNCGIHVTSIKIDPYINIDAGTFSPYEHGEIIHELYGIYFTVVSTAVFALCGGNLMSINRGLRHHVAAGAILLLMRAVFTSLPQIIRPIIDRYTRCFQFTIYNTKLIVAIVE